MGINIPAHPVGTVNLSHRSESRRLRLRWARLCEHAQACLPGKQASYSSSGSMRCHHEHVTLSLEPLKAEDEGLMT